MVLIGLNMYSNAQELGSAHKRRPRVVIGLLNIFEPLVQVFRASKNPVRVRPMSKSETTQKQDGSQSFGKHQCFESFLK